MDLVAQGVHGAGSRSYNRAQYDAVVAAFLDADGPVTALALHLRTGVPGRAIREIMSAADGVEFLLGGDARRGYCRAESPAHAEQLTGRFMSQVGKMGDRVLRRRAYVERAPDAGAMTP
jgi:hypothetical protein